MAVHDGLCSLQSGTSARMDSIQGMPAHAKLSQECPALVARILVLQYRRCLRAASKLVLPVLKTGRDCRSGRW